MSDSTSPSVKERAAAIERRLSSTADNARHTSVDRPWTSRLHHTPNSRFSLRKASPTSSAFRPQRPTRIFSKEIERAALQPRRTITKHHNGDKGLDNMKSISDIRGSIRSLRQRLDSTLIHDEPSTDMFSAANLEEHNTNAESSSLPFAKRHFEESAEDSMSKMSNSAPFRHLSTMSSLDTPSKSMYSTKSITSPPLRPNGSSRDIDQDQLGVIYAQYLQAVYKASQGSRQFERKQAVAEERIRRLTDELDRRQYELNVFEGKIRMATEINKIDELLRAQKENLVTTACSLAKFQSPVNLYMEKMDKASLIVSLEDPMWEELDHLNARVMECNSMLRDLEKTPAQQEQQASPFLQAMQTTCTALKQEIDLLCDCKQLLAQS
ncbi:hypothetical protein INT43_005285 [Umbelopsis isabellina]|uniref:Uncharacterized protein n=1 Tax=Mortierella isabellina TaxID=91625 RepID=A0A8H7PHC8_MORIS|nr:hypothetical protein INT43_005285 [Umbelopsis isabellina]